MKKELSLILLGMLSFCILVHAQKQCDNCSNVRSTYKGVPAKTIDGVCAEVATGPKISECNLDSDGDGILDDMDKCPTVKGTLACAGCPDADSDGIADADDKCVSIAGLKQFEGCPDTDGDGITDASDKCPSVAGITQFEGCPDTDGDGIKDEDDKCPRVAGIKEFEGCPDTDGDGVTDASDKCPNVSGLSKFSGCPDKDNDGTPDNIDKCPEVVGVTEYNGCPAPSVKTLKVMAEALKGVQFESGKDVILAKSFPKLDKVVSVLKENDSYNLHIDGHTDSAGDAVKNKELSKKRAIACQSYLVKKGIDAERLMPEGYGSEVPLGDNATKEGKALNRRVEFKIEYK